MNKIEIDNQIPIAIDLINEFIKNEKFFHKTDKEFGKIPKEYNGYISNFGASMIQSGLLATIAFFEANDSKSKADKKLLTDLILKVIYRNKQLENGENISLLKYALDKNKYTEEEVINAVVAVKLAIRVFEFTKK